MRFWVGSRKSLRAEVPVPAGGHPVIRDKSPGSPTLVDAINEWRDLGGRRFLDDILDDIHETLGAYHRRDRPAFHSACLELRESAEAAQRYAPIPDDKAQRYWAGILRHMIRAATIGELGTRAADPDQALWGRIVNETTPAGALTRQYLKRLHAIAPDSSTLIEVFAHWRDDGGQRFLTDHEALYGEVGHAWNRRDWPAFRSACLALRGSAKAAQRYGPIPDEEAQGYWAGILQHSIRVADAGERATRADPDVALLQHALDGAEVYDALVKKYIIRIKDMIRAASWQSRPLTAGVAKVESAAASDDLADMVDTTRDPPTLIDAVVEWRDRGGGRFIHDIGTRSEELCAALSRRDLRACRNACIELRLIAEAAQRYAPIPDEEAQRYWTGVLQYTIRTTSAVELGTRTAPDPALIDRIDHKAGEIGARLRQFTARLLAIKQAATPAPDTLPTDAQPSPSPPMSPSPDSPPISTPPAPKPVPTAPSLLPLVIEWRERGGLRRIHDLVAASRDLSAACDRRDVRAVGACVRLRGAVESAQRYSPVPDDEAQRFWATVLQLYTRAADAGERGTSGRDVTSLDLASEELRSGGRTLRQFNARIEALKKAATPSEPLADSDIAVVTSSATDTATNTVDPAATVPTVCRLCGAPLFLRRPGREVCARHPEVRDEKNVLPPA